MSSGSRIPAQQGVEGGPRGDALRAEDDRQRHDGEHEYARQRRSGGRRWRTLPGDLGASRDESASTQCLHSRALSGTIEPLRAPHRDSCKRASRAHHRASTRSASAGVSLEVSKPGSQSGPVDAGRTKIPTSMQARPVATTTSTCRCRRADQCDARGSCSGDGACERAHLGAASFHAAGTRRKYRAARRERASHSFIYFRSNRAAFLAMARSHAATRAIKGGCAASAPTPLLRRSDGPRCCAAYSSTALRNDARDASSARAWASSVALRRRRLSERCDGIWRK